MTEKSETKSKTELPHILGVASFCLSLIVAAVTFANMSDEKMGKIEAAVVDTKERVCALEAAIKTGKCGR